MEEKRYYDMVVSAARLVDNPKCSFKRVKLVVQHMVAKYHIPVDIDENKLRKAWREFNKI